MAGVLHVLLFTSTSLTIDRQTDGRPMTNSERQLEFTFAKKFCSCFMAWLLKTCLSGFNSNLGLPVEEYIVHILTYCSFISLVGFESHN